MKDILATLLFYLFSEDKKAHPIPAQTASRLCLAIRRHIPSADSPKKD